MVLDAGRHCHQSRARADIAWIFLAAYFGLVALRVMALGQPWTISPTSSPTAVCFCSHSS
jgi:hypothetical protein